MAIATPTRSVETNEVPVAGTWQIDRSHTSAELLRPPSHDRQGARPLHRRRRGNSKIAFSASSQVNREDFGLTWNAPLETGGVLVGPKVRIELSVEAVRA